LIIKNRPCILKIQKGNRFLNSSFDKLVAFSVFGQVDTLLTQLLLAVIDGNAGLRRQNERAYKLAA
jgi:hypothetical protein